MMSSIEFIETGILGEIILLFMTGLIFDIYKVIHEPDKFAVIRKED